MNDPAEIAHHDQIIAATKEFAQLVRAHYDSLRDAGFGRSEALQLAANFQAELIKTMPSAGGGASN